MSWLGRADRTREGEWELAIISAALAASAASATSVKVRGANAATMASIELFVPRSRAGTSSVVQQLALLTEAQPRVVSISGPAAGALSIAKKAKELGLKVQLQANASVARTELQACLTEAVALGVAEVLLLSATKPCASDGFAGVLEMVQFVVEKFGGKLRIVVTGFLRGTKGEHAHYSKDIASVAAQVKAGASLVLTTPVWDVNHVIQFQMDLKAQDGAKAVVIEPALLPLHALESKAAFLQVASHFGWTPPKVLAADLDKVPAGQAAWCALGLRLFQQAHAELKERCKGCTPHVITLNTNAALDAIRSCGYKIATAPAQTPTEAPSASVAAAAAGGSGGGSGGGGSGGGGGGCGGAPLSVPAGSTLHILHSGKLALEVGEIAKALVAKSFPSLVPALRCTEDFKKWAAETKLLEPDASLGMLYALFIVETVEEAQPCEAAGPCTRLVNKRANPSGCLARLNFAVLGLGDSNLLLDRQTTTAKDCNQAARALDARLTELGATPFHTYGESDDRTGNEEIKPWVAGLASALRVE